jgi:hypothetical protein
MLRHITLCRIMLCYAMLGYMRPPLDAAPYGVEGCPDGEDMGDRLLWEPMPYQPIPEPLGDGVSVGGGVFSGFLFSLLKSCS